MARTQEHAAESTGLEEIPWVLQGIVSGALGALVVAVFFGILDLAAGRPLWTPGALGSAFFLGESLPPHAEPGLAVVAGYTVLHGAIFVSVGLVVAYVLMTAERLPASDTVLALLGTSVLFVGFEGIFLAFAALFKPELTAQLGALRVAAANLMAAALMAGFLVRRRSVRRELH